MALAMETVIQPRTTQVPELNEFLVPKILGMNLKKQVEDRPNGSETNDFTNRENDDVNTSHELIENVKKKFTKILDHDEASEVDLDTVETAENEVIEMAPERRRDSGNEKQSSYLLQPFLKPIAQKVEERPAENPILRALFGSNNNKTAYTWISRERSTTNNCHPFKKTELSRDIVNEGTIAQIPKSLTKERQKSQQDVLKTEVDKEESQLVKAQLVAPVDKGTLSPKKYAHEKENAKPITADNVMRNSISKVSNSKARVGSMSSLKKVGYVNTEKLMKLRTLVDNAIKNHKVYSMTGCYTSVRNALKQRGWIEKIDSDIKGKKKHSRLEEIGIYDAALEFVQKYPTVAAMRSSIQNNSGFFHNDQINYSGQGEAEIINRMLRNINEDLCWLSRPYPYYCWKDIGKFDLVNRLPKAYFSNKIGLCNSLQHIQWYFEPGVCSTQYPRTYNMSQKDEYEAFKDDFRMTSCISLLKWLTTTYRTGGERAVRSVDGKVDSSVIDFALKRCSDYVKYREHEDIDLPDGTMVWEYQWDHFLTQYYKIINEGHLLKECKSDTSIQVYIGNALGMLNVMKSYWPQINIDGFQNYWVVKPGGRCCGNGIVIKNNLEQILMMVNPTVTRETRYVVQKYIERPLLIYNTKFDIRQWFLVTSVYPLTVWMYRESYLRFCSQPFSLKNTHESIHLCNNAVQRRYKNSKRDRGLPDENMWDCYTFQTYLKSIGHPDAWEKYIYPGMKEGFIGALLASQDTMERRKNCFELYGADFMISDTLTDGPWLIEINSNPAMDSSTSVTARMCPQVLEDIVKVVIDRRDDKNASTGAFEMVFKQHCPPVPPYLGMSLSVKGQKVHRANGGEPKQCGKKSKSPNSTGTFLQSEAEDSQSEERSEQRSECPGPARMIGSNLEKARDDGQKRTLSTEIIEGLKKEIVRATFSIRMNREIRHNLKRHSSEISRISDIQKDDVFKDNVILREITSEKLLTESLKNETQKESPRNADTDDEYLVPDIDADNIDMDDYRELHDFSQDADEFKEQIEMSMPKEIANSVNCTMRDLERITEVDENSLLTAESRHSLYYSVQNKSEEDIVKESERNYVQKESSYFISMCLKPNPEAVVKMVRSPENVQGIQTLSQDMKHQIIDSGTSVVSVLPRNGTEATIQYELEKFDAETSNPRIHDPNSTTEAGLRMNDVETFTDLQKSIAQSSTQCDLTAQVTQTAVQCDEKDIAQLFTRCHTEDAESFTDIDKYIIKRKVILQKNNSLIRKPSWKMSNSRSDQKKKCKVNKTKKVNFVQKNIQELRDMQDRMNEPVKKLSKARNTSRTAVKIIQSQDKECGEDNPTGYDMDYREEILKILHYTKKQKLMSLLCGKEGQNFANFVRTKPVHELSETTAKSLQNFTNYKMDDIFELSGGKSDNRLEIPPICGEIASQLGLKKESLTIEVITDEELQPMASCSVLGSNDLLSETIIRGINDMKVADKKKWQDSQIDWKSNVETARKACHEILSKLREFNESNSKILQSQRELNEEDRSTIWEKEKDGHTNKTSPERIAAEGDLKARKLNKSGYMQEVNKILEERLERPADQEKNEQRLSLKLTRYIKQSDRDDTSPVKSLKTDAAKRKRNFHSFVGTRKTKKESTGTTPQSVLQLNKRYVKKQEKFKIERNIERNISTSSFGKVVGLCRVKLQDMEDCREEPLTVPAAKESLRSSRDLKKAKETKDDKRDPTESRLPIMTVEQTYPACQRKNERSDNTVPESSEIIRREVTNQKQQETFLSCSARNPSQQPSKDVMSYMHINEILKSHAQKFSTHSIKSKHLSSGSVTLAKTTKKIESRSKTAGSPNSGKKPTNEIQAEIEKQENNCKEPTEGIEGGKDKSTVKKEEKKVSEKTLACSEPLPIDQPKTMKEIITLPRTVVASVMDKLNFPFRLSSDVEHRLTSPVPITIEHIPNTLGQQSLVREQALKTCESIRARTLKEVVSQAIKEHKIFCIFDSHWYIVRPVREELLSRGWLEVIPDKRLIPRRKPPPAGPTVDRLCSTDYSIQAILAAKEAVSDDVTEVTKNHPPVRNVTDGMRAARKTSEDSLKETASEFRIVPPSMEIKSKTNVDIRAFVAKYQAEKQGQKMDKLRSKKVKKPIQESQNKEVEKYQIQLSRSVQQVIDSINENWKTISMIGNEKRKEPEKNEPEEDKTKKETALDNCSNRGKSALSEADAKAASKMIQSANAKINFMWLSIKPGMHLKCFNYTPEILNKFQRTTFCTKIGLWSHLNNIQWYTHEVSFPAKSPRMYNTGEADDLQAFVQDFQMTACIGILKWLVEMYFEKGAKGVQKKKGKVPIKALEFAIRQCERYIRFRENEDLNVVEERKVLQEEWNTFLQWFYIITNEHGRLQETSNAQLTIVYAKAVEVLRVMKRHWPEIDVDGRLNIWIMKPYCASCGRGIFMTNNVYYIGQHSKYIVQKYIEKPFLIYNTKFDIRQWFMITKLAPLEIWMYKECYLRFCTQPFMLRNLHESVHLSNNSVQRKYVSQKDPSLPDQNMWDSQTFQHYLKTIGHPHAWEEVIYPGMRDAIISTMLASQDTFDNQRKSWFEVYGADFMISSNLKDGPWLIEINENPAMDPSTQVTAKLCPQMLRDVIKVVVDKRMNRNALTGQWELVYRQNYSPSFGPVDIDVRGKRIARMSQSMKSALASNSFQSSESTTLSLRKASNDTTKQYEKIKVYNVQSNESTETVELRKTRGKSRLMKGSDSVDKPQSFSRRLVNGRDQKITQMSPIADETSDIEAFEFQGLK